MDLAVKRNLIPPPSVPGGSPKRFKGKASSKGDKSFAKGALCIKCYPLLPLRPMLAAIQETSNGKETTSPLGERAGAKAGERDPKAIMDPELD